MEILSSCIYCGVVCRIRYIVEDGRMKKALPDREDYLHALRD
ncbi:MAG: hypothetical protein ACUVTL_07300 [Thermoproteota archaeon]